jgi:Protein of unknown function (DUF3563)
MHTLTAPRHWGQLWSRFAAAFIRPARRRPNAIERYLSDAVDFADLEHRMRAVEKYERRRTW